MSANKFPSDPIGTLRGHLAAVHSVSFLNVTTLGSGSSDGIVKIWNLKTRREKASIQAHSKAGVLHVKAFGNQQVLTQGRDGYIHLWDQNTFGTDTQQKLNSFYCGSFSFTKFAIQRWDHGSSISTTNQQSLIVAPSSDSMSIVAYDSRINSTRSVMEIKCNDEEKKRGMCMSLALVQRLPGTGDQHIFAGFEGGQLLIFDLRAGGKLACEASSVSSTPSPLLALDVTQDAKMVICGTSSEEMSAVKIDWNTFEMSWKPFYTLNKGGIGHICIRPDQKLFATGGWDTRVRIFHRKTRKPLASLKYHTESVFGLDFSMDNTLLASASKDKRIALWKVFPPSNAYKPSSLFS